MESLVTTFATSMRLERAAFPQEAQYWWYGPALLRPRDAIDGMGVAAPTAQEIADQLPIIQLLKIEDGPGWRVTHKHGHYLTWYNGDTMAEALAACWLKLHEALPNSATLEGDNGPLPTLSPELLKGEE